MSTRMVNAHKSLGDLLKCRFWFSVFISLGAAVTNYHTLGGLKQQKFTLSQFRRPELWDQDAGRGLAAPGGSMGESVPCSSPSFWWPLAILGVFWLIVTLFQLSPLYICVSPLLLRTLGYMISSWDLHGMSRVVAWDSEFLTSSQEWHCGSTDHTFRSKALQGHTINEKKFF